MTKLNNDDFAKICVAVDRFREHLGRDEAINTINAIIAERVTVKLTREQKRAAWNEFRPMIRESSK